MAISSDNKTAGGARLKVSVYSKYCYQIFRLYFSFLLIIRNYRIILIIRQFDRSGEYYSVWKNIGSRNVTINSFITTGWMSDWILCFRLRFDSLFYEVTREKRNIP